MNISRNTREKMYDKSIAVLITDVNQKKNRHLIGEIFEVFWTPLEAKDGAIALPTVTGEVEFCDDVEGLILDPDFVFDVRHLEILEIFDDNVAQTELTCKYLLGKLFKGVS